MCVLCLTPVPVQCSRNLNVWDYSQMDLLVAHGLDSKVIFFYLAVSNYEMVKASLSQTDLKMFPILSVFLYISVNMIRSSKRLFSEQKQMLQFSFPLLGIVTVKICLQNDKSVQ